MSILFELIILFFKNFSLVTVVLACSLSQILKLITYRISEGKLNLLHLFEMGGMPSAHSASVTALTFSLALTHGWDSPYFTISLVFALVVMYDATGVRRSAGKQAEILNKIVDDIYAKEGFKIEKLKELLGHDPIEVFAGIGLAIVVTFLTYYVYFIR